MPVACNCSLSHTARRIVLTGGPGAGKTAVLELVQQHFCKHVRVLRESASIVFGGGFPRRSTNSGQRAAQRAIFHVQRELEAAEESENAAIVLCDRGTVDGSAYWPGPSDLWSEVGSSLASELRRYDAVIHLQTPSGTEGYNHTNPLRVETPLEAAAIDRRLIEAWATHPRRSIIEAHAEFLDKARHVLEILRGELPACCRTHPVPEVDHRVAFTAKREKTTG
jgi:predicted ATPase